MENNINYLLTPWDEKSLGFKTAEVTINNFSDFNKFELYYYDLETKLLELGVEFIYTRVCSSDLLLRDYIQKLGFYYAETSIELNLNNLNNLKLRKLPKISYKLAEREDISTIKNIAKDSFNYGRFHEDVNISISKSKLRYYNWIDDLILQKAEIYVAKVGDNIVGFNIQKSDYIEKETKLILAGCRVGAEIFTLSLWNEILNSNKYNEMNKISALISASNIGVFNIYLNYNFKVKNTYFGFHKKIINKQF